MPLLSKRRTLDLPDGTVSILEWQGAGPALHFAHANGFNAQTYRGLLAPLADRFHILASDARGHGFTELPAEPGLAKGWEILRDDLLAILDALHPAPLILAGHSLGAVVSLMAAAARPERVRGLVLIEPVLVPADLSGRNNPGPALIAMARKRRDRFSSFDEVLKAYRGRGAFETWPEEILIDYLKGGLKPEAGGVRLACRPMWEADIYGGTPIGAARLASQVTCPVTLLYGDTDSTAVQSEVEIFRAAKARVVKVPGTSHFLPMEQPEVVREEIVRMAESMRPRPSTSSG